MGKKATNMLTQEAKHKKKGGEGRWDKIEFYYEKDVDKNLFKVPVTQRKKWGLLGRLTFNRMYYLVGMNSGIFQHPKFPTKMINGDIWNTTAWNVAWMAAEEVQKIAYDILYKKDLKKKSDGV